MKGSDGWRISKDLYREFMVGEFAMSPGTVIGSWAAPEWPGGPIPGRIYPPILPLTGSAETSFPFAAVMGAILLGLGLVVRSQGSHGVVGRLHE
ncbi:MAG: LPXTG cell wall anchor domain-containing protein [Chloroflexota bacterium]